MNRDRVLAGLRRWVGAFEEGWGRLIADETLRMRGELDRWEGRMQRDHGPAPETIAPPGRTQRR